MEDTANLAGDDDPSRPDRVRCPNCSGYRERGEPALDGHRPGWARTARADWARARVHAMVAAGGLALAWTARDADGPVAEAVAEAIGAAADLAGWALAAAAATLGGRALLDAGLPATVAISALRSATGHAEQRDLLGYLHRIRLAGHGGVPARDVAVAVPLSGEGDRHDRTVRSDATGAGGSRDGRDRPDPEHAEPGRWSDAAWRKMHRQLADFAAALPRANRAMPPTTRDTWPGERPDPPDPLAFHEPWSRPGDTGPDRAAPRPAATRCPACGSREIDVDNAGRGTWTPRMRCRDCRRAWLREEPPP